MISSLKKAVRSLSNYLAPASEMRFRNTSYSQEGEDLVLDRFFGFRGPGFYVDVGAHHPHRFSNTHMFYRRGWRSINIDAMPGSMEMFRRMRPRDINLEIGVGGESSVAKFFAFNERALNTFDEAMARSYTQPEWRIEQVIDVRVEPLANILATNVPDGTDIDFFTVDVEGRDLTVLQSNDWSRFRPRVVLVECLGKGLAGLQESDTARYLMSMGYAPFAKTVNTFFFVRESLGE
jgi:hypothetical protein